MKRMMFSVAVIVALFMFGLMQSVMAPAYAIEGAGGNADDGGGDNGHTNVVVAPKTRQPASSTGLNDRRAAPLALSARDQLAVNRTRTPRDRDHPNRDRDHGTGHYSGER